MLAAHFRSPKRQTEQMGQARSITHRPEAIRQARSNAATFRRQAIAWASSGRVSGIPIVRLHRSGQRRRASGAASARPQLAADTEAPEFANSVRTWSEISVCIEMTELNFPKRKAMNGLGRVLRITAWGCIAAIAVLSLLPAEKMVRTGAKWVDIEHSAAYAGTAFIVMLAYESYGFARISAAMIFALACWSFCNDYLRAGNPPSTTS